MPSLIEQPGYLFVLATLLPLAAFLAIFLASGLWCLGRRYREKSPAMESLYRLTGGDVPGPLPAYVGIGAIALAFLCSITGFILYERDQGNFLHSVHELEGDIAHLSSERDEETDAGKKAKFAEDIEAKEDALHKVEEDWHKRRVGSHEGETHQAGAWKGTLAEIVRLRPLFTSDPGRGTVLSVGYNIDSLSGIMFVMVTFIATLIFLFSIGYMGEERAETVEDHHVDAEGHHFAHAEGHPESDHSDTGAHHLHRRGRFGRFFMYLSLFCFSMLNLILADNLFQVFISWELVGICSYLLIGFYFERQSASNAAN